MGLRQCSFLERMNSEKTIVTNMVSNVNVIVKQVREKMEHATSWITKAFVYTNTARLVSTDFKRFLLKPFMFNYHVLSVLWFALT